MDIGMGIIYAVMGGFFYFQKSWVSIWNFRQNHSLIFSEASVCFMEGSEYTGGSKKIILIDF